MRTARERIAALARSFEEQDVMLAGGDPLDFKGYRDQIAEARRETGLVEACLWGWADIGEERCALAVMDFAFLGGSMGFAVGEKIANAFGDARKKELPVVTVCASGGARMQEGMVALTQMAKCVEAQRRHAQRGLAHVTVLTSPTTGGVYASFAALADVIVAEPGATIGFAGPRVARELTGEAPPPDVHTAEFAFRHGLIDAIVEADGQPEAIARILRGLDAG